MKWLSRIFISLAISCFLATTAIAWDKTVLDTVEVRYPDGKLQEQYQTVFWGGNETTTKTGFYRSWYANGQVEWDGHNFHDDKVGTWVRYDITGHRVEEISYLAGKEHGQAITWSVDGVVRNVLNYRNGNLHGLCTWRKSDPIINSIENIQTLIDSEMVYLDGELLVSIKDEHADETLPSCFDATSPYYNTKLDLWVEWKRRECVFSIGRKVDGKRQGIWRVFSRNGDLERVEYYQDGVVRETK